MIHYQLRCGDGHEFDGWFADSASFEKQAARSLVECPHCGETTVERALMAPAIAARETRTPEPPRKAVMPAGGDGAMPDHVRAALQRLRAMVEQNCEHVGPRFAEEARRIHAGDSDPRAIYGDATRDEVEALADDGIEVSAIPWVSRSDA